MRFMVVAALLSILWGCIPAKKAEKTVQDATDVGETVEKEVATTDTRPDDVPVMPDHRTLTDAAPEGSPDADIAAIDIPIPDSPPGIDYVDHDVPLADIPPGLICDDGNEIPWDGCTDGLASEFRVNTTWEQDQRSPALAVLQNDRFIIVWQSCPVDWDGYTEESQDLTGCGIFARLFEKNGFPAGDEFQVNILEVDYHQYHPAVVDAKGGFAISWLSYNDEDDFAPVVKLYWDASSPIADEVRLEGSGSDGSHQARLSILDDLTVLLAWEGIYHDPDTEEDYGVVYAQRVADAGGYNFVTDPLFLLSDQVPQGEAGPSLWRANNDNFIALYDVSTPGGAQLYTQLVLPDGQLSGTAHQVNQVEDDGMLPATARTWGDAGSFVTTRFHSNGDGGFDIAVRRHEADGTPIGIDYFIAPEAGDSIVHPEMDVFPGGETGPKRLALAWQREATLGLPDPEDVFVARVELDDNTGKPKRLGSDAQCNRYQKGSQARPMVGVLPDNHYVVVWESCPFNFDPDATVGVGQDGSGCGVYAQLFDENGDKIAPSLAPPEDL